MVLCVMFIGLRVFTFITVIAFIDVAEALAAALGRGAGGGGATDIGTSVTDVLKNVACFAENLTLSLINVLILHSRYL